MHTLTIIAFLLLGYTLGKITCNTHFKKSSLWITFFIFATINALHSFIDGAILVGTPGREIIWVMVAHEIIRQPALYALFLGITAPFTMSRSMRLFSALLVVTGIWAIAFILGTQFGGELNKIKSIEPFIDYFKYLFIGDIIHHVVDWLTYRYKNKKRSYRKG